MALLPWLRGRACAARLLGVGTTFKTSLYWAMVLAASSAIRSLWGTRPVCLVGVDGWLVPGVWRGLVSPRKSSNSWFVSSRLTWPSTRTPTGVFSLWSHLSAVAGYVYVMRHRNAPLDQHRAVSWLSLLIGIVPLSAHADAMIPYMVVPWGQVFLLPLVIIVEGAVLRAFLGGGVVAVMLQSLIANVCFHHCRSGTLYERNALCRRFTVHVVVQGFRWHTSRARGVDFSFIRRSPLGNLLGNRKRRHCAHAGGGDGPHC